MWVNSSRAYSWIRCLAKGTIKCPNFSQENDPDEWDLTSTKYDKDEHYDAEGLKFIKAKAHPVMRDKMEVRSIFFSWNHEINKEYGKLLRSDFAASVCQVTTANSPAKSTQSITTNMKKVELDKPIEAKKITTTKTSSGSQIKTKKLLLKETFMCTVAEVYNVRYSSMSSSEALFRFLSTNKESMLGLVEQCNRIM